MMWLVLIVYASCCGSFDAFKIPMSQNIHRRCGWFIPQPRDSGNCRTVRSAMSAPVPRFVQPMCFSDRPIEMKQMADDNILTPELSFVHKKAPGKGVMEQFRSKVTSRRHWNSTMIDRLQEGVRLLGTKNWKAVAEFVGCEKDSVACKGKWHEYFKTKDAAKRNDANWTDREIMVLRERIESCKGIETPTGTGQKIDWIAIGQELGRSPFKCQIKWDSVQFESKGHFTADEDALILQRVQEWGEKGRGVWSSLEKELQRPASGIRARWGALTSQAKRRVHWTEDMDAALVLARETAFLDKKKLKRGAKLWQLVSDRLGMLGWSATSRQCSMRYFTCVKPGMEGLNTKVTWTPKLTASLLDLRAQNGTWADIGRALHIAPVTCTAKWKQEEGKLLRSDAYSAQEDALIRQRVQEWGDPREARGLWPSLQREMGRPAAALFRRWFNVLYHKSV